MEFVNGVLCIEYSELVKTDVNPAGVMSPALYRKWHSRFSFIRRGCNGRTALIDYLSIPSKYRVKWEAIHGDPFKRGRDMTFIGRCKFDEKALQYYMGGADAEGRELGEELDGDVARRYANEASVLRTLHTINQASKEGSQRVGKRAKVDWDAAVKVVHAMDVQAAYPHKLPTNGRSLQRKLERFVAEGYGSLVHRGRGNANSSKRTAMLDRLVMALYTMPNKPFNSTAYDNYQLFLKGKIDIYDKKTGELFDKEQFLASKISAATFWSIINNPLHRAQVDEKRNDSSYNLNVHRPFQRRRNPNYSLSKISMDDRDLPRLMNGGGRVKAYYAYDVASGCVVGAAYSRNKDEELFLDCLRDMFRNIHKNGWGMPAEVEVENHLVNKFFDDLAVMFPIVKICIPGNHREKRAEHLNRSKKYTTEKKNGHAIGRWWARSEAYRKNQLKVDDEVVEKTYSYDELVRDDMADVREFNMQQHPRKIYGGASRWQVLTDNLNPDLQPLNHAMLARYIGYKTATSVRNSKEVQVQGLHYQLGNVRDLGKLQANNKKVDAYYLRDSNHMINEVYIYQGDKFISKCDYIAPYNEARAEWTDADRQSFEKQSKYDAQYRAMIRESKEQIAKVDIIEEQTFAPSVEPLEKVSTAAPPKRDIYDVAELIGSYSSERTRESAEKNL